MLSNIKYPASSQMIYFPINIKSVFKKMFGLEVKENCIVIGWYVF